MVFDQEKNRPILKEKIGFKGGTVDIAVWEREALNKFGDKFSIKEVTLTTSYRSDNGEFIQHKNPKIPVSALLPLALKLQRIYEKIEDLSKSEE